MFYFIYHIIIIDYFYIKPFSEEDYVGCPEGFRWNLSDRASLENLERVLSRQVFKHFVLNVNIIYKHQYIDKLIDWIVKL